MAPTVPLEIFLQGAARCSCISPKKSAAVDMLVRRRRASSLITRRLPSCLV